MPYAQGYDIRRLAFEADGRPLVDRITDNLLGQFSEEYAITSLPEDKRFEHFSAFCMIRRHYSRSFVPATIVLGGGGDTAIDAIAIIVNNVLVNDVDTVHELAKQNGFIEASFIFVQAERSSSFDAAKLGSFGFGVKDFFATKPLNVRNKDVSDAAEILQAIFSHSTILRPRPACFLYYVTTGKWQDDANLIARRSAAVADLEALSTFESVDFVCVGADELHKAYTQTKTPVTREFLFATRTDIPEMAGVVQAFLGFVPFSAFRTIISDESKTEILGSIFYDNVRDWQEYNIVNDGMRKTLDSPARARFVLMNNGVTIIAKSIRQLNNRFTISDFQIVNGCQTSHVLFDQKDVVDDSVFIPLRLIETRDEDVIEEIIHATNSQTDIKPEQFFAGRAFSKKLELYFESIPLPHRLYYERRDGQYDRGDEQKTKIITPTNVIRAFGSMFLSEPHRAVRDYRSLRDRVGSEIFGEGHKLEPYYVAAYASYYLEYLYRNQASWRDHKVARYQILLAVRLLMSPDPLGHFNSHGLEKKCSAMMEMLWDTSKVDGLFDTALKIVGSATGGNWDRDHVHTIAVTNNIVAQLKTGVLT